jgi:sirohydrochlorin cobaltochelatase
MSTIRSTSQPGPVTEHNDWSGHGLLLIGHGSQRSAGPNRQLLAQVDQLRKCGPFETVEGAVLYGEPTLETAIAILGDRPVHVLPMFMCDGMFTRKIIPKRLDESCAPDQQITFGMPVGLSKGLPALITKRIRFAITRVGLREHDVRVVLVGHGSTASDASWQATERQAARLRKVTNFKSIETSYLDQYPKFEDTLNDMTGPVYVVGLFVADGLHAGDDIPNLITASDKGEDVQYLGAIGSDAGMVELVVGQLGGSR